MCCSCAKVHTMVVIASSGIHAYLDPTWTALHATKESDSCRIAGNGNIKAGAGCYTPADRRHTQPWRHGRRCRECSTICATWVKRASKCEECIAVTPVFNSKCAYTILQSNLGAWNVNVRCL